MVECAVCKRVFPGRQIRYNKCPKTGDYEAQCSDCRALIRAGQLEH